MDLTTKYLGLELKHPLIAGASPLPDDLGKVRALEDGGIAAITMYSLFEEQITQNLVGSEAHIGAYENSFSEAASYFPEVDLLERGVEAYLDQLQRVKKAVSIPVIGSLNGTREGAWVNYASLIEEAGADALELNLYFLATDLEVTAAEIEDRCVRIVESVKKHIEIPLSVKLSPYFTALPQFAKRLKEAGADGLVLFNRFYQPDIDTDELDVRPKLDLSNSPELRLRLRWLALLSGRLEVDLSVSGGVHTGIDMVKSLMAGAHSIQMVSGLLLNGPSEIQQVLDELSEWMEEKEYSSLEELRGCLNYLRCPDPEALERANYMRVLKSFRTSPGFDL
jgi:dihydroorotate dehydrogenase (fumarate)